MAWAIKFEESAKKELASLDKQTAKRIITFLKERIALSDNPRKLGKTLKGSKLGDFYRYRVGNYRIICVIEDDNLLVIVIRIAHRKEVYR
ncbi:MAG: type II toxin-antitoxin system mRNA interferase toxin, RelE/StbE family [Desulfurella sp.]|uniref:type II toxin-antitoxin system RelE family toxin n=1 Tax=Desulfurella sp. TaxID=1962857 RepID=UPI000CCAB9ED|nr:type II toxin-antitoxin system RelE/ParE family toxin [Desulfurella sp.]PMP90731.1 MAG: type II toxin-antitoxin system mRNA interferase toxin, RelE/StbE family [Desulfurella sp.]HEX13189.1 type II toxin-antitoxin system RelE/ParE family toxin [Desulfurella acetivorans]